MAATLQPVQPKLPRGTKLVALPADQLVGNTFPNDGTVLLFVEAPASNPGPATLVVITPVKADGDLNIANRKYIIAPGETWLLGPFPPEYYTPANGGLTTFTVDQPLNVAPITVR